MFQGITLISAVALSIAAIAGILPLLAAGNALGFFRFGMQALTSVSGALPSRKRVWGTVYDSRTMRPLPYADVRLLGRDRRILEQRVADHRGRYAFLTSPDSLMESNVQVLIETEYAGYVFPSHAQVTAADQFVYDNLYHGEMITVDANTLIGFDIPMDARSGKAIGKDGEHRAPSVRVGIATAAMADTAFWIGLVAVPLAFILQPNPFTFGFVFLYIGTVSLRVFGIAERPFGVIRDAHTGNAIPFALITLRTKEGARVGYAVSDEKGRYTIQTQKGEYDMSVHTPANVQPPRVVKQHIGTKGGWLVRELEI